MIGTGYVGLVTGTCLADCGHDVTCIDINQERVEELRQGKIPIYEPGLTELVLRNTAAGRLAFAVDAGPAVKASQMVFLCVGTPSGHDGAADLSYMWKAVEDIAPHLRPDAIVVTKSTVPVGTNQKIYEKLQKLTGRVCDVASNPEFLKEGAAVNDFMYPDRVVIGVRTAAAEGALRELYAQFLRTDKPMLVMTPESAELTKYVANALLACKISFINEMANVCERLGGDINDVRRGIGHDRRIGFQFLFPGVGYGGSCFPKDVRALASMSRAIGIPPRMLEAIDAVNDEQKFVLAEKIKKHFSGQLKGKTIAIWGLAFKPKTDDIREAPALVLIDQLLKAGAKVQVHDPEAMDNVKKVYGDKLIYGVQPMDVLEGADALAINTEWGEFRSPDFDDMKKRMVHPVVFDGRNLYDLESLQAKGFTYYSVGRTIQKPTANDNPLPGAKPS